MAPTTSVVVEDDGPWWRVRIGGATGNILDAASMDALTGVFADAGRAPALKAVILEGAGPNFSYGTSVHEHLPEHVAPMLARFRTLVEAVLDSSVVLIAAVRGRCLGGGLELVTLAHRIVASPDATFGQPEIALGVFPPVASILLPHRVGRAHADDLCLTGRTIDVDEARAIGLVDEITEEDPADVALQWARAHLASKSAASLRRAVQAVRLPLRTELGAILPNLERLYLDDLMKTADAVEGLRAFLEKRPPKWRNS